MKLRLMAFGIAKEILGTSRMSVEVEGATQIHDLRTFLEDVYPDFARLASVKFALNDEYVGDLHRIQENDEVIIIPPVSGG